MSINVGSISRKPKIAILTIRNSYKYGGVFTCLKQVYKFCEKYFDPTVFYLSFDKNISANLKSFKFTSEVKNSDFEGMKSIEIGSKWAFWEPGHYVYNLSYWKKVLDGYDYFFVISGTSMAAYPLVQLSKKFPMWIAAPYLDDKSQRKDMFSGMRYLLDKLASFKMKKIEKTILKKADFIWALSKYTKIRFEQILQSKRENMVICNYPMELKPIKTTVRRRKEKRIIAVGRFSDPRKNIEMLFRAFSKLYKDMPESKLYIVGSKPSEKDLLYYNFEPSFKNIIFTGSVDNNELQKLYKQADLMLITSYQEGLGIIALEALSYKVPVVATDCGGTRDCVIDNINGYLVKINDDEDMYKKALKILFSKELSKKMGENGRKLVEDNFSLARIHAIFKMGLIKTYPELKSLFDQNDAVLNLNVSKTPEKVQVV